MLRAEEAEGVEDESADYHRPDDGERFHHSSLYDAKGLMKVHPMFDDWDGEDKGAFMCGAIYPHEVLDKDIVLVDALDRKEDNVYNFTDTIKIYVHWANGGKAYAEKVARKIKKMMPDYDVVVHEAENPYPSHEEDDYDY